MPITFAILGGLAVVAAIANHFLDYNHMFLRRGDGTPYDIVYNMVGGNQIAFPLLVIFLFVVYILVFHEVYQLILNAIERSTKSKSAAQESLTHK